jgi:hypothetical protein
LGKALANRKKYLTHSIWELCYNNINVSSPLFALVGVFEYYFTIVDRSLCLKVLDAYLCAVGLIDFRQLDKKYTQTIQDTIYRIYEHAKEFWPEQQADRLTQMVKSNKLDHLLSDLMDIEEGQESLL